MKFRVQKIFYQKFKKRLSNKQFKIFKTSKNILVILFLHILHMPSFKKLALIATKILGKTSAETAETVETATEPKTIPPAVFKNGREVKTPFDTTVKKVHVSYFIK